MSTKIIRAPRTRKPSDKRINTLFNHRLFETLAWRMQQAERFSTDDRQIAGIDLQLWDIVIGDPYGRGNNHYCVVTTVDHNGHDDGRCNNIGVVGLTVYRGFDDDIRQGANHTIYFDRNQTYRTITELELVDVFLALEAMYADAI